MSVSTLENWRKLKELRAKMVELEQAIENFEGELMGLGALRAKHYVARVRANELQELIRQERNH